MQIIEIDQRNFNIYKRALINLNDAFLKTLKISKNRTEPQKEVILKNMVSAASPTHLLVVIDDTNKAVGMTYFNEGTGYSCGGNYIWLNSIYIHPEEQQKGYGLALLKHVEDWAKQRNFTLFTSSRHSDNKSSKKLFDKAGFEQSTVVSIDKTLNND